MKSEPSLQPKSSFFFLHSSLLWLAGISLRITVLAIPPVLPAIHETLGLNEKAVAILTALPILLLAGASSLGSLVIHRVGARRALIWGLLLLAAAGAARGLGPAVGVLFAMTFVMGCGIAVCQPALPSIVGQWFPRKVGLATAIYSNGLLIGEITAAALTLPLLPLLGGSWESGLAVWSLPVALSAGLLVIFTHEQPVSSGPRTTRWWPDWGDPQTWRLGLLLGGGQVAYWLPNAFLAEFLSAAGHPEYTAASLAALNGCQIPASILVALLPGLFIQKRWPILLDGVVIVGAVLGLVLSPPAVAPLWAGLLGFAGAFIFILNLALPPLISEPHDVHRLSAGIFSISYTCAFVGPLIGGAIWDGTGLPATAFVPAIAGALLMFLLALKIDLTRGSSRPAIPSPPG